ncbi:MAG TPA: hypothetical protein VK986_16870, partial [Tepidisphaeraceae bacterium]|nr:hypothetical protein [Tepidisphaeraceae bacterium]
PIVAGGTVAADDAWGSYVRLDGTAGAGITLRDDGKLSFEGGVTIDMWVYLEGPTGPAKGAELALKVGSFAWDLNNAKLNTTWLAFPAEPVFTDAPRQFKTFPVGGDTINGLMTVPRERWVRLTMAYDEALGAVTTQVGGTTDRFRYRYRGPERMRGDGKSPIVLLQGVGPCRVGAVRVDVGRPRLGIAPTLEVYANNLPYRGKVMLTFDHVDPELPLPLEATLVWENPGGEAATAKVVTLSSHAKADVMLDLPAWKNALHTLTVHVTAGGRGVTSKTFRVASVKPAGPVRVEADRSLSRDGKKFFPLMVYHARPADFPLLREIGFNVVFNDFTIRHQVKGADRAGYARLLRESLDAAKRDDLLLLAAANAYYNRLHSIPAAKGHAGLLGWYGADEPWGDLTRLVESYNTIKMLEPDGPVVIIQNNYSRLQETAMGADIVGTDPYPVPNVSLRAVADATRAARSAVSGQKPVWTVLPQYDIPKHEPKLPTRAELRCMVWIAAIHGADGLGLFTWDDRTPDAATGKVGGWYTKEHPERVEVLRSVVGELRSLEVVLLAPAAEKAVTVAPANPAVHAAVRVGPGGKRWLLIASDSRRAEEVTVSLGDGTAGAAGCLADGGERAAITFEGGACRVALPALAAGVYELPATK